VIENRICITVGGLCFELVSDGAPILHEITEPYRNFTSGPSDHGNPETVRVRVTLGEIEPPGGQVIFDGGSWRLLARGNERSLVFQTRFMTEPLYEARFRARAREVELTCSPRLLESADGVTSIRSYFRYPLDQVLAMYLLGDSGLIIHAAGVVRDGRALVFAGVSGAGKSTLIRLATAWSGALALNDDRILLRIQDDTVMAYGTPWPGEAAVAENQHAEAGALLFLEKGQDNRVRAISHRETLARLLPTVSLPWFDPEQLEAGLRACDAMIRRVPAAVFTFRPEEKALDVLDVFLAQPPDPSSI
jgi:hypothetical protein